MGFFSLSDFEEWWHSEAFDLSLKTLESGEISAMFAIPTLFLFNMQFSHLDKNFHCPDFYIYLSEFQVS